MMLKDAPSLFDSILDFLSTSPSGQEILEYRPTEGLQSRLSDLLSRNGEGLLGEEERPELDEFRRMNRFMSRLKARVRVNQPGYVYSRIDYWND